MHGEYQGDIFELFYIPTSLEQKHTTVPKKISGLNVSFGFILRRFFNK